MIAQRVLDHPIVSSQTPGWDAEAVGFNFNGPSLIRVPDHMSQRLGRYYLYFAHHSGNTIRLAYADELVGPWTLHPPGCLPLSQTPFSQHLASPDVHWVGGRLLMVYHGCGGVQQHPHVTQPAALATSTDGLEWIHQRILPAESYLRAFTFRGQQFGIAKGGRLYHAPEGDFNFGPDHIRLGPAGRHWAVMVQDDTLHTFYSRFGDCPEHLVHAVVETAGDWTDWRITHETSLLSPAHPWEGANLPTVASVPGAAYVSVHQLRDPGYFEDADGQRYLLYSGAGESAIGLAKLNG